MNKFQHSRPIFVLLMFACLLVFSFFRLTENNYLSFSDAAKFGDIGRNLALGFGYGASFTRFDANLLINKNGLFSAVLIPPLTPYLDALAFKLFGAYDFTVIGVSVFSYLFLTIGIYLFGKKLWGNFVGLLAAVAVAANISFLGYAVTGASEPLFGAEIVFAIYFFSLQKKWSEILGLLFLVLLYLTRPQAPFFIVPIFLYFVYLKTKSIRKTSKITLFIFILSLGVVLASFLFPTVSILAVLKERIIVSLVHSSTLAPANDVLRSNTSALTALLSSNFIVIFKKLFYNVYNSYKLLPNIFSPYLIALFLISLFRWGKDKTENAFKLTTLATLTIVFLVNAVTIPLYRYLHSLMPLIYLFAIAELVWIVRTLFTNHKSLITALVSAFLIFFFVVGQSLGYIFLDSRFTNKIVNKNQPPVYVTLSRILKDNTKSSDIVVTNLDTWGSWYGERRTIWYPLEPSQLNELDSKKVPVDAIYLTSYLMDDENYYMGAEWRGIFENPEKIKDEYVAKNFKLKGIYSVPASDTYEKIPGRAVLLIRK